ncbi:class I ribonucleotide reductase maintenance protein YfaE [Erwinia sp. BNK-24-b]|uniref:class I ribonucleotide reductase maintenance protein YfaE n=1 Tax=Erwinia TaxID=551 RepID=UPI001FEF60C9|nr:class I ribonucleotide reductase maintenance protein YfaE [Erwinia phyllosphaerae]MBV4365528.1 2Fe-2S ferredoxin-like protein [Erwinia phyllosphaerae]
MTGPIIKLRASGTQLHCHNEHRSLLDALEFHQVCVEYQCREGYCGSCRIGLLQGQVSYSSQPLAFIKDGEILPCCCKAEGDIELEL